MSGDRSAILGALKRALDHPDRYVGAPAVRIAAHKVNLIPTRGAGDREAQISRFTEEAETVSATVARISSETDLPTEIARYLSSQNLPAEIRIAPALNDIPWDRQPTLTVNDGPVLKTDTVGVNRAFAGVAETGTVVFRSGPESPTTLNFLPLTHIAVLSTKDLHGHYEAIWTKLRAVQEHEPTRMPRTINMVTGPSATGDIEQTMQHGAHGPQNVHIVLIDDENEVG